MKKTFNAQEIAEVLLQILDGEIGSALVDEVEYIGYGIHKIYLTRDVLEKYSGREDSER